MIAVDLPAVMRCDEGPTCAAQVKVELCLLGTGGFGFRPASADGKDWQVGMVQNGAFVTFCPAHKKDEQRVHRVPPGVQVGPAGPRVKVPHGH